MVTRKFEELFRYAKKSPIKAGEGQIDGKFPFYTSSAVVSKRIDKALYDPNSLVFGTGGSASVHFADTPFSTSTDCIVAEARGSLTNPKFVYYYLLSNIHILEKGFKGAGLKHISKSYINKIEIPILPIEIQNKIVLLLDKAGQIIRKRNEAIKLIDDLLYATFLEMFGVSNPDYENWADVDILSLSAPQKGSMRTGPFGSSLKHDEFEESGDVAVLGIDNAVNNCFKWGKPRFISTGKYNKFKQYTIYPRDVIITIMGTVGRSAVIPNSIGLAINTKHLAAITLDESKCNPYYLAYSIHSNPFVAYQMKSQSRGAVMAGFNLGLIKKLKLKAAPIELQNKFETVYIKNRQCRDILLESQRELECLWNSISQRILSGQLILDTTAELEAIIMSIDLLDKSNDISSIKEDSTLLKMLIDKLNTKHFPDIEMYDKAKHIAFQLLSEDDFSSLICNKYDEKSSSIKLEIK